VPAVLPALLRNALLRFPTTVLVLASLGFLGLGEQPPTPEWGRLLSENQPYVELAPWTVLGPAGALVLFSVLAVSASAMGRARSRRAGASAAEVHNVLGPPATGRRSEQPKTRPWDARRYAARGLATRGKSAVEKSGLESRWC
jgi:hypothetical protein